MTSFYGSSFESYLLRITDIFRKRTAKKWMVLALGWVLQTGAKTTAGLIRGAGSLATRSFSAYYKFFRTTSWEPEDFWEAILHEVLKHIDARRIMVGIDDTHWQKVGRKIEGCSWYPSKKSLYHRSLTYVFGQCWVCLSTKIPLPWTAETSLHVPVMGRLYKPKDECEEGGFKTRLEIVNEMLWKLSEMAGDRLIVAVADSYYGGETLLDDLPETVEVMVRLKRDSQLYEIPERGQNPGPGRPRKKGDPLKQPKEWIKETEGWKTREVQRYGETETVRLQSREALWYHVTGEKPGRVVMIKEEDGSWFG